jgi:hypothetical protein
MDKSKTKIEPMFLVRLALLLAYVIFSTWTLLVVVGSPGTSGILILLVASMLVFVVGNILKRAGILFLAWAGLGISFVGAHILLRNATYFSAMVSVMLMLVLLDLADFLGLMGLSTMRNIRMTRDQSTRIWHLVKRRFSHVALLSMLSCAVSLAVIALSIPVEFAFNPILGFGLLASTTLLLVAGLALAR